ncbi:MAG: L,D-transpeptidase family protein [Sulfurimonadaceae bacterium]|nr:L,D-transpeptidase family protein [Sulfurimonadaceae bacterium]
MVKILLLLIATLSCAQDLATLHRTEGFAAVQRTLDRELGDPTYWQQQLEKQDTRFGYFENTKALLSCDKTSSVLKFWRRDDNGSFVLQNSYGAYTGKANGDKIKEGDLKTPVGVYRLTKKLDNLDPFYGPLAFVTSYPNFYDRIRGKNGSGIWIHGLPTDAKRDPYTRGCIAIENGDLECMDRHLNYQHALLVIDQDLKLDARKEQLAAILSQLFQWRYAWLYNDLDAYLSFYADEFIRHDGMKIRQFRQFKKRIFARNDAKEILFKNIAVVPYPGDVSSLYTVLFDEEYSSKRHNFSGKKGLIVKLLDNGRIQIIAEQ